MSSSLDLDQAPTLDELLRGCVDAFDAQGKVRDPQLVRLFLATHPWYLPQAEVAGKLLTLVQESGGSAEGPSLRLKIGHLVRYWVRAFPQELSGDPQVLGRLRELGAALGGGPRDPPRPREPLCDIRAFARSAGTSSSPALRRLVALSNGLSRWVQLRVLRPLAAPQRAAALGQCLHLAQSLLELRNFNSLLAVVGGARPRLPSRACAGPLALLTPPPHPAVGTAGRGPWARGGTTGATGAAGGRGERRGVPGAGARCPPAGPGGRWRQALPDWGGPGRPHPNKLRARFALQGALLAGREQGPPGTPHPDLLRLLEVSLALGPSEEQLHQMSLQREAPRERPREAGGSGGGTGGECGKGGGGGAPPGAAPPPSPPSAGCCPSPPGPTPRGCDPASSSSWSPFSGTSTWTGDGRISVEEFGIVRENFPPPAPLGELDTDMDGGLSRGEVLDYFPALQPRTPPRDPPHNFRGLRGLRAGPCETCGKLIWGLHKDGLECSGCGLRCHIACRERLRPECRRRAQSVAAAPPDPPGSPKARPRSFSLSLPWPRRPSLRPTEPPEEVQELEDGVFDTHL
ncbi:RAS guanyl-releasing protein 2-like [Corvus hawaiiensis]|uniref:RAS guanyl-releasing protein 2-like n=1 Tax=Corvus hawaiiensis TaxID=134902 RepID=UPI002019AE70|nr:RAS guanyl-releasing protein 2-like [Corvus hawaiiensis]